MNPNDRLNLLSLSAFIDIFQPAIDDLCTFKGVNMPDEKLIKIITLLHKLLQGKFSNLVVNDVNIAIGNIYMQENIKVTTENIMKFLQKRSNEKNLLDEEAEKEQYKHYEWNCERGRALVIRTKHDPGGHILEQNGDKFEDIVEAVKKGYNYYTTEPVVINRPEHLKTNVNKLI